MTEFELIARLTRNVPTNDQVVVGPGDDCAVLDLGLAELCVLFKTDAVVENVHFTPETPAEKIGRKALARNLSDIAAMGGSATAALVTLGLPKGFDERRVEAIYGGITSLASEYNVAIAGGETTTTPTLFISIALLGTAPRHRVVRRAGANAGDAIFVTGHLGGSRAGWHLDFQPRLAEGSWLAQNFPIHAMLDLSDGLAGDIRHILNASHVGAELHANSIPISQAAKLQFREESAAKPPLLAALTDGEDFELLFTVASRDAVPLLDAWREQFPDLKLTCIGKITAEPGLRLRERDGLKPIPHHGYTHFS